MTVQTAYSNLDINNILPVVPRLNKYIIHTPTPRQYRFLCNDGLEVFFGGAVGGGKSDALLMAALQWVDKPDYAALLIRDTYKNLSMEKALMDRAFQWLSPTDAHWNGETKRWTFPSGATLSFGYLDGPRDHHNFQSAEFQFIGIDEIASIRENQAMFMFSRLRKLEGSDIPIRFRCASNPPLPEQLERGAWVKERYVNPLTRKKDVIFIPSKLDDNPYLNKDEYIKTLNKLDPITLKQLVEGDWNVHVKGKMFDRAWFKVVDSAPMDMDNISAIVRYWDRASTEPSKENKDPDYTVGCKMIKTKDGLYYITSIIRFRKSSLYNQQMIRQTADMDGKEVYIGMEQEGGSSGKDIIDHYRRIVLSGFVLKEDPVQTKGSKITRARPLASQAEAGNVFLVAGNSGYWIEDFLEEFETFPDGAHDDIVDAASGAFAKLNEDSGQLRIRWLG